MKRGDRLIRNLDKQNKKKKKDYKIMFNFV